MTASWRQLAVICGEKSSACAGPTLTRMFARLRLCDIRRARQVSVRAHREHDSGRASRLRRS